MVRIIEGIQHECPLPAANVVADALIRTTIGSVSHVEEEKKELVKDAHRLA